MNCRALLKELESLGSAQTRKTYCRHGVNTPQFGVSYKSFGILKKRLKTNHPLALELWATGNHDARVLATMIADATALTAAQAESMVKDVSNSPITDALAGLVGRSRVAKQKAEKWMRSKKELIGRAGWQALCRIALDGQELDDDYFAAYLPTIEAGIHAAPNRTREAMNMAVIAIGVRSVALRKLALAAAKRIGRVEVDHGDTCCKTPDAAAYIAKTVGHCRRIMCG
jgi:3-methyladenine DNA glycosylase AlkD